jgi:hypothetical protein
MWTKSGAYQALIGRFITAIGVVRLGFSIPLLFLLKRNKER